MVVHELLLSKEQLMVCSLWNYLIDFCLVFRHILCEIKKCNLINILLNFNVALGVNRGCTEKCGRIKRNWCRNLAWGCEIPVRCTRSRWWSSEPSEEGVSAKPVLSQSSIMSDNSTNSQLLDASMDSDSNSNWSGRKWASAGTSPRKQFKHLSCSRL